jgi:hypothetical protein
MKYFKLFIISVLLFGVLFLLLSLLFPKVTYVSRAINIAGPKDSTSKRLPALLSNAFAAPEAMGTTAYSTSKDTLFFNIKEVENVKGAVALYAMGPDSTTLQLFYTITTPWYQPVHKFGLMLNEAKYGPSLDSTIENIKKNIQ